MKIFLTRKGKGIFTTRTPTLVRQDLALELQNAAGAVKMIATNGLGNELYRTADNGAYSIPLSFFERSKSLSIVFANQNQRWKCDEIIISKVEKNIVVEPAPLDLVSDLIIMQEELDRQSEALVIINNELHGIKERLSQLLDGHDFI